MKQGEMPSNVFQNYAKRLGEVLAQSNWQNVEMLALDMRECWKNKKQIFLCGNGGSAGNAIHLANDYLYGIANFTGKGMRTHALSSNPSVITCLANDISYEQVFAEQLAVQGQAGDLLLAFSGSGNSPNIQAVLKRAKLMGVKSYAVLGFSGGVCKELADVAIHFAVDDMQISEDLQLIVGHMLMQWLSHNKPGIESQTKGLYAETVSYR